MSTEKHCAIRLIYQLETVRSLWSDLPDKQRLEVLKSVIWTAPDMHGFHEKAVSLLTSNRFKQTLD